MAYAIIALLVTIMILLVRVVSELEDIVDELRNVHARLYMMENDDSNRILPAEWPNPPRKKKAKRFTEKSRDWIQARETASRG